MALEHFIWFEKYRPKEIAEMSLTPAYKKQFEQFVADKSIPHLLLAGVQGSGKTTTAYVLMNQIPCTKLVLNASGQDRGIDTVKTKIVQFASSLSIDGKIKIILLDEADSLTKDAQTALRNTMETYSKNCRFILTCNYVDKIIPALQSRCTKYTFDQFPKKRLVKLLQNILAAENIADVPETELTKLIQRFFPDVRSIINSLQAACSSGTFNAKAIGSLQIDPVHIGELILEGKLQSLRQYIAGTTDFTFIYKWLFDSFLYEKVPVENQGDVALEVLKFAAIDQQVPDREMQVVGCFLSIMMCMDIKYSFQK